MLALSLALAATGHPAARQESAPRFMAGVELVSLPVTVEDKAGRIVTGLTRDDFSIFEEGVRQEIAVFSNEPQPIAIAVLIDFSRSMQGERHQAAVAAVTTLGRRLDPHDRWRLFPFADRAMATGPWGPAAPQDVQALLNLGAGGGTRLFNSVVAVQEALVDAPHRKRAILIVSDGNDVATQSGDVGEPLSVAHLDDSERRAVAALRAGESLVYALGMDWPYRASPGRRTGPSQRVNRKALRALTDPTGGKVWVARTGAELVAAADQLLDELRQQYTLGYSPTRAADGKFRRVRVTIANDQYRVRFRQGYIAAKP